MAAQISVRGVNKVTKHGIEVPSTLTYKSWEPGGEYTKPLILKNVNLSSKRIRYKMPQSQIFSTTFPQPIVLGSGTSHTLPVTFKPLERRVFSDSIEIVTNEGSFFIPIRALLPTANLALPSSLQFGMCSVLDDITVDFNLSNISDVSTNFQWEVASPFKITPVCGTLKSRGVCKLQASFHPENVSVFEGVAVCLYGENQEFKKSVKLEGIGKYPHLVASVGGKSPATTEVFLSFGDIPVGQSAVKWIHVTNVSPVSTSFDITSLTSNLVFTCSEYSGIISPEQVYKFKMIFQPRLVESCCEQFIIKPRGGISNIIIKCTGRGQGACVEIVEPFINFGNIACGTSAAHLLHIKNNSQTVKAVYQFQMLPVDGIFSSEGSSGIVAPSSSASILLHFTPIRPIAYHKKLVCLVHLLAHPLYVDLIGTAFTETTKPAVIQSKHLSLYTSRVEMGLSRYSPEQLQQLIANGKLKESEKDSSLIVTESFDGELEKPSLIDQSYAGYLTGSHDPTSHHVSVDTKQLEFDNQLADRQTVNITNHTLGKLYCIWTNGTTNKVFNIIPEERELLAGACCSFTVTFTPPHPGKFYSTILDCYICYKSMRDQQDNDSIITIPWCISIQARGHSFISGTEAYIPRALFNPSNIVMPSAPLGHKVYQTALMINNGNSPIGYDFQLEHKDFTIYPSSGLLQDNHQVFIVTVQSSQLSNYQYVVKAKLNGSDKFTEDLTLCGMVETPTVKLEYNGDLYFMPTCIQCSKASQLSVTNLTSLQLDYHWRLLQDCNNVLSVSPSSGTLLPNETQYHTWTFTPRDVIMYKMQAILVTNSNIDPLQKAKSSLNITGQGELGHLKCDPTNLQLDTLVVGMTTHCDVILHNAASCELSFYLYSSLHILHTDCSHSNIDNPAGVELTVNDDAIPAGGRKIIRIKIRPCVRGQHTIELKYQLKIPNIDQSMIGEQSLCSVAFNAVYPTISVTSVLGEGSLSHLSKSRLWNMLSIDKLNRLLQGDPSSSELRYALKTRYSTRRKAAVHTNAISEVTFGASPLNMPASVIHLEVENKGQTPTQWAFQFPDDLYLEPAYWAMTGKLDQVEKDEMNIMDNELFTVHPRTGNLQPSEVTTITFSFKHKQCGSSRLPILLKISRGREVLLFFHGVTVPNGYPYIFFTDYHHYFTPVPIGSHAFPRQVYELYNGGDKSVNYVIDTQPLEQLQQENYQMNVLECLEPTGVVPAKGSTVVQFVFAPQEVKSYIVELAINFEQHKTVLISFTGEGYDPSQLEADHSDQPNSSLVSNESNDVIIPSSSSSHLLTNSQAVKISHETITFGHFPLFATVNRIIFLRNSTTHTMSYQWMLTDDIDEVITFTPSSGYLQPMEAIMCKVTFLSRSSPQLYHLTIPCKIMDQTALLHYQEQLTLWEEQEEERKHLFTITERDLVQQRKVNTPSQSDLKRYQALPPIGHTSVVGDHDQWNKLDLSVKPKTCPRTKKEMKLPTRPEPLTASYLKLTINATTYSIPDYCQQFDDLDLFFIDKQSITVGGYQLPPNTSVSVVEKDIITSIGSLMLKDLLSDGNLISAIKKISEEPLPYFVQYSQKDRNTGGQAHARHSYAAALEQLSRVGYQQQPVLLDERVRQDDQGISDAYNISQKTTDNTTVKSDESSSNSTISLKTTTHFTEQLITLEDSIKHLPDFDGLVGEVLNGTILNIVQETIAGEANITKLLPTIATPRCNNNN